MPAPVVLILGTCDTKLSELLYLRSHIIQYGVGVKLMDVGAKFTEHPEIDYTQFHVLSHLSPQPDLSLMQTGEVIRHMISAASKFVSKLYSAEVISGAICIGGSGGTSLCTAVMRAVLPIGFPKIAVSTVASGNVSNFVGESDITMMHSVVDIAGQNSILNPILENAAAMIQGGACAYQKRTEQEHSYAFDPGARHSKGVAITMFGVTTPAVDSARQELEKSGYEVFVFHATGIGGRAMEQLVSQGRIEGVLDLTTTELADEMVGGIMKGGPDRLTAASKAGIPQVISLGALDIVNFGPRESVPAQYRTRLLYEHNPDITLLRTSVEENWRLGQQIAEKLISFATQPERVHVFVPLGGTSMLSTSGGPFEDKAADKALFGALGAGLEKSEIKTTQDQRAINDEGFSTDMARSLMGMLDKVEP